MEKITTLAARADIRELIETTVSKARTDYPCNAQLLQHAGETLVKELVKMAGDKDPLKNAVVDMLTSSAFYKGLSASVPVLAQTILQETLKLGKVEDVNFFSAEIAISPEHPSVKSRLIVYARETSEKFNLVSDRWCLQYAPTYKQDTKINAMRLSNIGSKSYRDLCRTDNDYFWNTFNFISTAEKSMKNAQPFADIIKAGFIGKPFKRQSKTAQK